MTESPELNGIFTRIRDNLDAHYDRRERLIKISRDITAQSKKMIFALQRIQGEVSTLPPAIQKQIDGQEGEIKKLLARAEKDIQGPNAYRYVARAWGGLTVLGIIDKFPRGYRNMYGSRPLVGIWMEGNGVD